MKFYLDSNIVEGTPEELVKYQELLEEKEKEAELLKSGHAHQPTEEEKQVTFQGLLGSLKVKDLYASSTESSTDEEEEDAPMGYTFWYIDGGVFNNLNVLKVSLEGHFEDSTGTIYTYQAVHGLVKPVDNAYVREEFEDAKHNGKLLKYSPTLDEFAWK